MTDFACSFAFFPHYFVMESDHTSIYMALGFSKIFFCNLLKIYEKVVFICSLCFKIGSKSRVSSKMYSLLLVLVFLMAGGGGGKHRRTSSQQPAEDVGSEYAPGAE